MIAFIGISSTTITITTGHNQLLPKTRSIPYWTTSVFSSTVTDLVLIYESVTSSASVGRWLALHSKHSTLLTESFIVRVRATLRRTVYRQSVRLGDKPHQTHDQNFYFPTWGYSPYVTSYLMSGWVCRLQLMLVLVSAVILRCESHGTHDHIYCLRFNSVNNDKFWSTARKIHSCW
jgi:hypothetical protein